MQKIYFKSKSQYFLSDLFTPVGLYLRLRDKYRDSILLESADSSESENSYSFIAINAIAGIEVTDEQNYEIKFPLEKPKKLKIQPNEKITDILNQFCSSFVGENSFEKHLKFAQGLFGYTSFNAIPLFEKIKFKPQTPENSIPLIRYRFYQYVIVIHHFKNEMYLIENQIENQKSEFEEILNIIHHQDIPRFPFETNGEETSNLSNLEYKEIVNKAIKNTLRGDVFQLVLSRRFQQKYLGDDFNVYRSLRSINPSPYLFYFDYGNYKLFGSSPESQLIIKDKTAVIHPIAGTFKRTGEAETDARAAIELQNDAKENAEHTMLVDLARNDLSKFGKEVRVNKYKSIHYFSHVIHMVSEVVAKMQENVTHFEMMASTFPQGTLSGAPKHRALQLINEYESTSRGYYGGCIGFVGFDGSCNQAIMIRTFLCKNQNLYYQAGAGIVAKSNPESELQEVNNKLNALKKAIQQAHDFSNS